MNSGLSVRNLISHPLFLGEKLNINGRLMGFGEKKLECRYLGINLSSFRDGGLHLILDCGKSFVGPKGEVLLGSVSGAATLDEHGQVVGVFSGANQFLDELGRVRTFLRSTPIFIGTNGSPQLTPELIEHENLTFSCVNISEMRSMTDFANHPKTFSQSCVISNDKGSIRFNGIGLD